MTTANEDSLQGQLDEISTQIPPQIAGRLESAIKETEASGVAPGLVVGDHAPDFTLPDSLGRPVSLHERLTTGPVVLIFYRGEWCPYCNTHLRALQATLPDIRARGASLIAISPQTPAHALSHTEKVQLTFDVLSDIDQEVIKAYKVQFTVPADLQDLHVNVFHNDLRAHTADGSWHLPIPATFVIDRAGMVRAAHVSADYRTRMEPADITAALVGLS